MKMPKRVTKNATYIIFGLLMISYIACVYALVVELEKSDTTIKIIEVVDDHN